MCQKDAALTKNPTIVNMTTTEEEKSSNNNNKKVQTIETNLLTELDNVGVRDLLNNCHFGELTENFLVLNLSRRFASDICYTRIGPSLLLALRPPKLLQLYSDEIKGAFSSRYNARYEEEDEEEESSSRYANQPPHIYSLFNNVLENGLSSLDKRQLILFSGVGGSGKSFSFGGVVDYLAFLGGGQVQCQRVGECNNLLNFFTGAMETESGSGSWDSTRCVKLIEIDFDFLGNVCGSQFHNFYLEKFRLLAMRNCHQRNFHIFYVLIGGCKAAMLKSLGLSRNMEKYRLLSSSSSLLLPLATNTADNSSSKTINLSCLNVPNNGFGSYGDAWEFVRKTLTESLQLPQETFQDVCKILAAILLLGNVSFTPKVSMEGVEGVDLTFYNNSSDGFATTLSQLLGLTTPLLTILMTSEDPNTLLQNILLNLYTRLVSFIQQSINDSCINSGGNKSFKIALLDYPGEKDSINDFEEICISYVNERVQFSLVDYLLRSEQERGVVDGLEWIVISTTASNNSARISTLIDAIINTTTLPHPLNCPTPSPTRSHSHSRSHTPQQHYYSEDISSSTHQITSLLQSLSTSTTTTGTTKSYTPSDFHSKNSPTLLPLNITQLFSQNSTNKLLNKLFLSKTSSLGRNRQRHHSNSNTSEFPSTLTSLNLNINNLIQRLSKYKVNYVKCIKPSAERRIIGFENSFVRHQLGRMGVVDVMKVNSSGWIRSFPFYEFLRRYGNLSLKTTKGEWRWGQQMQQGETVQLLLADLCFYEGRDYSIGRSCVFIKGFGVLSSLESYRSERLEDLALLIQKTFRSYTQRKKYKKMLAAVSTIQNFYLKYKEQKKSNCAGRVRFLRAAVGRIQRGYILWKRLMYLNELSLSLPSMMSPICRDWPFVPSYLKETNSLLKILFHRWRCRSFRTKIENSSPHAVARLNEKATASFLFKDKKESYERSLGHPFCGDYIRLRQNSQWRRNNCESSSNNVIVFADLINKIARSSGKFTPIVLVVTTTSILFLDARTLKPHYIIHHSSLPRITMSPFNDDVAVFHVNEIEEIEEELSSEISSTSNNCLNCHSTHPTVTNNDFERYDSELNSTKGDVIVHTCHLVEMITKIYLVRKNLIQTQRLKIVNHHHHCGSGSASSSLVGGNNDPLADLQVSFLRDFPATYANCPLQILFINSNTKSTIKQSSGTGGNDLITPSQIKIKRTTSKANNKQLVQLEFSF